MSLPPTECIYITEDLAREWKNCNNPIKLPQPVSMIRFLYELCWTMVRGDLPFQKCQLVIDSVEFLDKVSDGELSSSFADVVTQMSLDLTMPGEYRARLIKLAKWMVESALVPMKFFHERCEEEFLWEAEMIKIKAQDLKGKEVRVNTRLLYQQTKFNLLREESEGYAKLATLLCRGREALTNNASAATVGIIKSLIGHFDLDPNRVFDIVLECFELQPDNSIFLELIPIFPKSHASQILGFKFQYYQRMDVNLPIPRGLYHVTALLVKEGLIDLDSIYSHLLPKDDDALEHYNAFCLKRLDEANKIGKINLAATGKDLMDDDKPGDVTVDLFAAIDVETDATTERFSELENSQTLGLLSGFLSVNDWYHAHMLFDRLSSLNPVGHTRIRNSLLRLIDRSISPAFKIVRQSNLPSSGSLSVASIDAADVKKSSSQTSFIDIPRDVFQMLVSIGPYLHCDAIMLQKVCRVLRAYYQCALELVGSGSESFKPDSIILKNRDPRLHLKEARARVEEALGACLLPSLQLIPANPAVGQEIWEVMSLLPYEARYRFYGEWEKDDEQNPMVVAARLTAKLDTRRILKRLAKENLKQLGRMVAKLAHANPMTVLRTIVHQIEAYKDMIAPVVDAFKYLTQLEYDILEYVVIERLVQGGREKLKDDGINLSDWLQSLASFWGHLCKKYPSMELRGLFQYLVNQLKRGKGIELVLLQELVQQMANIHYTENLTEDQLDAMAGGETLRYQATSFGIARNKALIKSTNRLRESLLPKDEPKLAIPLMLLIAQHRSVVVINSDAPYIKMVCEQFDRCHGTLLQYVDFLCNAVTPAKAYAQLVPSLHDLIHLYHLDPEVAFLIYRPVMRHFKCEGSSDVFWPLDDNEVLIAEKESEPTESSRKLLLDLGSQNSIMWSDLLDTVRVMLPKNAWNSLSPDLYATFWGLTLYDLYVPRSRYEYEIAKQHAALKALEELSDNSNSAITKRKKEKERIQESLDRLTNELRKHEENVTSVKRRLAREKDKWLSSCPDTLKINMEFLQRCIFPRCTFSMPDAVYCAMFVHTLHSLGTPFFNTVNHIDVLICKTLQPMICCCTEYEAGRLGRFLHETLKTAYYWKSDESIYERECGNMPGFAVYYRYPNSQRVTFGQFIKVHWKWSQRITRLLIQCLESAEYMEIRNALIMLTKISSVFPVTRKTGINLEKRVAKIKTDEREDLKVLATGVAAALASRKASWVSDEEFGMGYEIKPPPSVAAKTAGASINQNGTVNMSLNEPAGNKAAGMAVQRSESGNVVKEHVLRTKLADGLPERTESGQLSKPDSANVKLKMVQLANGSDSQPLTSSVGQAVASRLVEDKKLNDDPLKRSVDDNLVKATSKVSAEPESRTVKRSVSAKPPSKQDPVKDDNKSGKSIGRNASAPSIDAPEGRQGVAANNSSVIPGNGTTPLIRSPVDTYGIESKVRDDNTEAHDVPRSQSSRAVHSPRHDASRPGDKPQKRASPSEDLDRLSKRRRGDTETRDTDHGVKFSDKETSVEPRFGDKVHSRDFEKAMNDDQSFSKATTDKALERTKDKANDRYERDYRDRSDKMRGDDNLVEKPRDRSMERYGRERSVERLQDRIPEKSKDDKNKDGRSKVSYSDIVTDKNHVDDRFHHGQSLPPPPFLPIIPPHSGNPSRRDEDADRRFGAARHSQRLSPRHDEKERRWSEENMLVSQDDTKYRREEEFRDRKREEREPSMKAEEREKPSLSKDDIDTNAAGKRRKLKRDHLSLAEEGEYSMATPLPPHSVGLHQSYDVRERVDRKGAMVQRVGYVEEPSQRMHGKEVPSKMVRREPEIVYERDWEDEKRQRAEQKRRHRK